MEALPHSQSDVVHTLEEAAGVVGQIGSPAVRTMFDSHNAEDETEPHDRLIERIFRPDPARACQRDGRAASGHRRLRFRQHFPRA